MARVLILGGGCRGRRLATLLAGGRAEGDGSLVGGAGRRVEGEGPPAPTRGRTGHAVRMVTRTEAGRAAIEGSGAECVIGDPGRLATLRGALEGVTVACWLLAGARGEPDAVGALNGPRLRAFLGQAIDTTMRGFVYEAPSGHPGTVEGERIVEELAARNAIPAAFVRADPEDQERWLAEAFDAIGSLLGAGEGSAIL